MLRELAIRNLAVLEEARVTFSGAVPTIWADILRYGEDHEIDLSSVDMVVCGSVAVPSSPLYS